MKFFSKRRKAAEQKRIPPETVVQFINRLGHADAEERQKVNGWDDWETLIKTGYWTG